MAQLSTVREVAIQRAVSRPIVHKMLEAGVFPQAPIRLLDGGARGPRQAVDGCVEVDRFSGKPLGA